ncbi:MAG: exodeoxyribonuclease V subunit gamma, partial [Micrococcales bacterium]|nr:exodeoxyribonuclease V subunit gamma [Micrococcales bacterium]
MGRQSGQVVVHVAEQADTLVDMLGDLLVVPLDDPFATELVAVETQGVSRWVAQQLSLRLGAGAGDDGICAQVRFDPLAKVVAGVLAHVVGVDRRDDPWHPDRLVWQVLAAVDDHLDEPWLAVVRSHLGDSDDEMRRGRRLQTARLVTSMFTAYDVRRPQMLTQWAAGHDTDGAGAALPDDLVWQARLWRAVADRTGTPAPSQRLGPATEALRDDPGAVRLPARLSVFAPTTMPEAHLQVLGALSQHRDVHLWLVHPSVRLWQTVAGSTTVARRADLPVVAHHRLLASMARPATELQLRLSHLAAKVEATPGGQRPPTVLGALQQAMADDRPASPDRVVRSTADRSLQVHACPGRTRQVEVLRDVLTGLLAADPTLEPRDVVVLCPDLATFAPLVEAVFDPVDAAIDDAVDDAVDDGDRTALRGSHPGRTLRVRVDRTAGDQPTNPLLAVLEQVLTLASSRVTASDVLDLARTE